MCIKGRRQPLPFMWVFEDWTQRSSGILIWWVLGLFFVTRSFCVAQAGLRIHGTPGAETYHHTFITFRIKNYGWEYSSVVGCFPSKYEAPGSGPSTQILVPPPLKTKKKSYNMKNFWKPSRCPRIQRSHFYVLLTNINLNILKIQTCQNIWKFPTTIL